MKKKNLFGWLAMAAMVLGTTGCSNDEVVNDYSAENAIEFGTYVGKNAGTRALVIRNNELKVQGFGVYAAYTKLSDFDANVHTMNFMNNTQVKYNTETSKWEYSPVKYWPNNTNEQVSFFAYAPYDKAYDLNGTTLEYEVPTDIDEQRDLTWNNTAVTNVKKQSVDGTVKFVFQHALSKVDFTIQAATDELDPEKNALDNNTVINVKKVTLCGGTSTEEITSGAESSTITLAATLNSKGVLNLNNTTDVANWNILESNNSYELTEDYFATKQLTSSNSLAENNVLIKAGHSLMILPQTFDENGFCVYIEYEVVTTGQNANNENDNSTITNKILKKVTGLNFESGKQYKLHLILGMTSVKVEAETKDWVTSSETDVDLPQNKESN